MNHNQAIKLLESIGGDPQSKVINKTTFFKMVIVGGAKKALALSKCIEEGINHMWTVSAIQMHPRAMIVCDEDATLELRVKTVKYFKGLQETNKRLKLPMIGDAGSAMRFNIPQTGSPRGLSPSGIKRKRESSQQ